MKILGKDLLIAFENSRLMTLCQKLTIVFLNILNRRASRRIVLESCIFTWRHHLFFDFGRDNDEKAHTDERGIIKPIMKSSWTSKTLVY
jgi:hypothetical protein